MAKYQYHLRCQYFNSGSLALDERNDATFYDELFREPVYTGLLRFQLRTAKDQKPNQYILDSALTFVSGENCLGAWLKPVPKVVPADKN